MNGLHTNEAAALLDWYLAMGVDEALEEMAQDHAQPPAQPRPTTIEQPVAIEEHIATAPSTISATSAPILDLAAVQALADSATTLAELEQIVRDFKGLTICTTATNTVFADGAADADLMVIGEAPGAQEDRQGTPLCGPSGLLLDKMLLAIGRKRTESCYITNSIFWRPPGNRTPSNEEIATCRPFVNKHIALIKPKALLLVGGVAIRSVLQQETSISRLRNKVHHYSSPLLDSPIPAIISYHPSYLLRQPLQKKLAWADLLALQAQLP